MAKTADDLRQALIAFRKDREISREQFAAESGFNRNWVEKFEQGVIVDLTLSRANELSAYLAEQAA